MAVDVKLGATVEPGIPEVLFQTGPPQAPWITQYCVTKDGQRFLLNEPVGERAPYSWLQGKVVDEPIQVVLNWFEELNQKVPTDN